MLSQNTLLRFLSIVIVLYSCDTESIEPTSSIEQIKSDEVKLDFEVTESGINVTTTTEELETKLKKYFNLDKIKTEEQPALLTRMFFEQYNDFLKSSAIEKSSTTRIG